MNKEQIIATAFIMIAFMLTVTICMCGSFINQQKIITSCNANVECINAVMRYNK